MKTIKAKAPGKIILFGEHAVVYGVDGIACALDKYSTITVSSAENRKNGIKIDNYNEAKETNADECEEIYKKVQMIAKQEKYDELLEILKSDKHNFMKYVIGSVVSLGLDVENIEIKIETELRKGMGTSSSIASAAIFALAKYFGKELTIDELNDMTYQVDIFAHGGRPSGIDNNTIVRGGYVSFRKGKGVTPLDISAKANIVIGDTHVKDKTTGELVEGLRKLQEKDEIARKSIYEVEDVVKNAVNALKENNLKELGALMDKNQELLRKMQVSHPKLEKLIRAAKDAGALGAKLSGAGGGGIMYALVTPETQDEVAKTIEEAGGEAIITTLGVEGVQIVDN